MTHIIKKQSSPYTVEQMFALVADFERYPEFLPFCTRATSLQVGDNAVQGTLYINKGPFRKSFTTYNEMLADAEPAKIVINLVNGPFKILNGEWRFIPEETGCQVVLDLRYDMKSGLLNSGLSGVFEWIAGSMVEAFCREARQSYQ